MNSFFEIIINYWNWWYYSNFINILNYFNNLRLKISNSLELGLNIRYWLVPIFNDNSVPSKILSIIIRTLYILYASGIISIITIIQIIYIFIYLLVPLSPLIYLWIALIVN
jgi:hypothetical protein